MYFARLQKTVVGSYMKYITVFTNVARRYSSKELEINFSEFGGCNKEPENKHP